MCNQFLYYYNKTIYFVLITYCKEKIDVDKVACTERVKFVSEIGSGYFEDLGSTHSDTKIWINSLLG